MRRASYWPKPAVSALIIDGDRVLLVLRGREPNAALWSLPGGSIEPGETMRDALVREVYEETSLRIEVRGLVGVHDIISVDGESLSFHYVLITFRASVVSGELRAGSDAAHVKWVTPHELENRPTIPGLLDLLRDEGFGDLC